MVHWWKWTIATCKNMDVAHKYIEPRKTNTREEMTNGFLCIKSKISKDIWQWMGTTGNFGAPVKVSFVKIHQAMHMVRTSLLAQMVKRLSTMQETWVQSLDWEDPLEKEMAIHSSTLAWKIPWTEEPGRLQSMGSQRVGHDWVTSLHFTSSLLHFF